MITVLKWMAGAIAAYVVLVPLGGLLWIAATDWLRPRRGLPSQFERRWVGVGAVMMNIAEQVDEGRISPVIAERRLRRVERYTMRLSAPESYEKWAFDGISFAKGLVRTKFLAEAPSPSAKLH